MNKIVSVFFIAFSITLVGQNAIMNLTGTIKNNTAKDVIIKTATDEVVQKIPIRKDKVNDKIDLPQGNYKMMIGQEYTDIYVANGNLNFTIDLKEFDETIKYTGSVANENNYLASKMLDLESYKGEKRMYLDKEEKEFLDSLDIKYSALDNTLQHSSLNQEFRRIQLKNNRYERWQTMMMYPSYHPHFTKKENFKPSEDYYKFLTQINVNDKESVGSSEYLALLNDYFNYREDKKIGKITDANYDDSRIGKLELIRQQVYVPEIRDELVKMDYKFMLGKTGKFEELKNAYIQTVHNPELKKEIEVYANRLNGLREGNPAPAFSLENNKGEKKSLSDYRGKYVYIDVWATWCGPCKRELPFYEEVKKQYKGKNIEFVSVCVWDKKDAWTKFLTDKNLNGEQLFNEQSSTEFTENYMVEGVPTFVLIDREGKLISRDAERPSDPALKVRLNKLLNN